MSRELVVNTIVFLDLIKAGASQWEFFEDVKQLGVSKIEIRREWIKNFLKEMPQMVVEAKRHNLDMLYSVPETLFSGGQLNGHTLVRCLEEAEYMDMKMAKFTVGEFDATNIPQLLEL